VGKDHFRNAGLRCRGAAIYWTIMTSEPIVFSSKNSANSVAANAATATNAATTANVVTPIQGNWRYCYNCHSMFYTSFPQSGVCLHGGGRCSGVSLRPTARHLLQQHLPKSSGGLRKVLRECSSTTMQTREHAQLAAHTKLMAMSSFCRTTFPPLCLCRTNGGIAVNAIQWLLR
jgi:hypothetical protein